MNGIIQSINGVISTYNWQHKDAEVKHSVIRKWSFLLPKNSSLLLPIILVNDIPSGYLT